MARAVVLAAFVSGAQSQLSDSASLVLRMALAEAGYREVPLERTASGALTARAHLDSHEVRLLVDSKEPLTFIDRETVVKLGYSPATTDVDINFGGASEPLYSLTVSRLAIGQLVIDSMRFDVTRVSHVARAAGVGSTESIAGIVGGALLRRCAAMIDISQDRMFLCEPEPELELAADTTSAKEPDDNLLRKIGDGLREREKRKQARDRGANP
jgi:hypothetical protein